MLNRNATAEQRCHTDFPGEAAGVNDAPVSTIANVRDVQAAQGNDGLYLYALVENSREIPRGITGVEGEQVFGIPCRTMSAIVHSCPLTPYASEDKEVVTGWVVSHEQVLEQLLGAGMTTIPFTFDTIIKPENGLDARRVLTGWLSKEYETFVQKFEKVRGKKEYGVQVSVSRRKIGDAIAATSDLIQQLDEEAKASGPGKMYLIRQKREKAINAATDAEIAGIITEITGKIQGYCSEIHMGKLKKWQVPERDMILNCSCLVPDENYPKLGSVLEEIEQEGNVSIRFTGPWAAYSFV